MDIQSARKKRRSVRQADQASMSLNLTEPVKEHLQGELIGQTDGSMKVFRHACVVSWHAQASLLLDNQVMEHTHIHMPTQHTGRRTVSHCDILLSLFL